MNKKRKIQPRAKVTYCSWEDLKRDPEQLAIYKEIAEINCYMRQRAYEDAKSAAKNYSR